MTYLPSYTGLVLTIYAATSLAQNFCTSSSHGVLSGRRVELRERRLRPGQKYMEINVPQVNACKLLGVSATACDGDRTPYVVAAPSEVRVVRRGALQGVTVVTVQLYCAPQLPRPLVPRLPPRPRVDNTRRMFDQMDTEGAQNNSHEDSYDVTSNQNDAEGAKNNSHEDAYDIFGNQHDVEGAQNDSHEDTYDVSSNQHDAEGEQNNSHEDAYDIFNSQHDAEGAHNNSHEDAYDVSSDQQGGKSSQNNSHEDAYDVARYYAHNVSEEDKHNVSSEEDAQDILKGYVNPFKENIFDVEDEHISDYSGAGVVGDEIIVDPVMIPLDFEDNTRSSEDTDAVKLN